MLNQLQIILGHLGVIELISDCTTSYLLVLQGVKKFFFFSQLCTILIFHCCMVTVQMLHRIEITIPNSLKEFKASNFLVNIVVLHN